jgi:TfoX/Sxy family transcriptional regulator of competence genes
MAYDERLAYDIRARLAGEPGVTEKEMFGGIAFMVDGNMAVGVSGGELMVRVGKEAHDAAITRPGARQFDMTGRPMKGWLVVSPDGFATESTLDSWVSEGVAFARSLSAK